MAPEIPEPRMTKSASAGRFGVVWCLWRKASGGSSQNDGDASSEGIGRPGSCSVREVLSQLSSKDMMVVDFGFVGVDDVVVEVMEVGGAGVRLKRVTLRDARGPCK